MLLVTVLNSMTMKQLVDLCNMLKVDYKKQSRRTLPDHIIGSIPDQMREKLSGKLLPRFIGLLNKSSLASIRGDSGHDMLNTINKVGDSVFNLVYVGTSWKTTAIVSELNGDLIYNCNCHIGKFGGLCYHEYIGLCLLTKTLGLSTNFKFTDQLLNTDFSLYTTSESQNNDTVESILRNTFIYRSKPTLSTIERMKKPELLSFIKTICEPLQRGTKKQLVEDAVTKSSPAKLIKAYENHRLDSKMEYASEYMVDIKECKWTPSVLVVADIQHRKQRIVKVDGDIISHPDCNSYSYVQPKFCTHLIALFLELGRQYPSETLSYLVNFVS